jgi:hypothetical protein
VRAVVVLWIATAVAACNAAADAGIDPGDDAMSPPPGAECARDTDCVLAGPTCCDCPETALPITSGWGEACEDVTCPLTPTCTATTARCNTTSGLCELACAVATCGASCPAGFLVDDFGCLGCACAPPGAGDPECDDAADCVRVRADCCGCANGGEDTAVPVVDADAFDDSLNCPPTPSCPGVDVCDPDAVVACRSSQCVLESGAPIDLPPNACGRDDLPPCPTGERCTINSDPEASQAGVGVCTPG